MGPNVKKLIVRKMSRDAIPDGGGLADGIKFLSNPSGLVKAMREATEWVEDAILAIRQVAEPNPWKAASDEDIAGEILSKIESRK